APVASRPSQPFLFRSAVAGSLRVGAGLERVVDDEARVESARSAFAAEGRRFGAAPTTFAPEALRLEEASAFNPEALRLEEAPAFNPETPRVVAASAFAPDVRFEEAEPVVARPFPQPAAFFGGVMALRATSPT